MTHPLQGRSILVIEGHVPAMHDLAGALRSLGADVALVCAADVIGDRYAPGDSPDCVVVSIAGADRAPGVLVAGDGGKWSMTADAPQFAMLQTMQALHKAFADRTWAVVMIGASLGMTGAGRHVALATATEGQRGMMKSLARQWGDRVRLNWLAVWTPLLFPEISEYDLAAQPELGEYVPSLKRRPVIDDVAQLVAMLGSPLAASITGQTIIVDGGEWMLP